MDDKINNPTFTLLDYSIFDDDDLIDDFIKGQQAEKTIDSTKYAIKTFQRFLEAEKVSVSPGDVPAAQLDHLLCKFFITIKKVNGEEYEPDSLTTLHRGIQRHLDVIGGNFNILQDELFAKSRKVLAAKRKQLVKKGLGNKPNATRELEEGEVDKLFTEGYFGSNDPMILQRTMWWFTSLHFGFRARDESRKLCWGDVGLEFDPIKNQEYLVWYCERGTKTRTGKENEQKRMFNPRVYATGNDKCAVKHYKIFKTHRPKESLTPASPFFLAIKHNRQPSDTLWYFNRPLGKNKIGEFLSKASKQCSLSGRKVANHSVRKTSIGRLLDANVPEIFVTQHSGHKNVDSLQSYKSANKDQIYRMSTILSGDERPSTSLSSASTTLHSDKNINVYNNSCNSSQQNSMSSIFAGATFSGNCTFNIYYGEPEEKKRRIADRNNL